MLLPPECSRFDHMGGKPLLALTLFCFLGTIQSGFSQISQNASAGLDSIISSTANMLNASMIDRAWPRIDSLANLITGKTSQPDLLSQLKIRSLQGRYLLLKQQNGAWSELYDWCKMKEVLCQTEEELNLLVRLFNNAGIAFRRLGRLSDSEEAFLKSTEVLRKLKNPDYSLFGSVYSNAGNSLKQIGEFDRSIEYFEQSIRYFNEFAQKSESSASVTLIAVPKSSALDNLGLVYQCLAEHQKAIEIFHNCIDFKLQYYPQGINQVYSNLAISLVEVGKLDEAKQIIEKILAGYVTGTKKDQSWALATLNLADIDFQITGDTTSFLYQLDVLDLKLKVDIPEAQDTRIAANQLMANLLLQQKNYQGALEKWSEAMNSISLSDRKISPFEVPYDIKTVKFNKLIELMNLSARVFYTWGKQKKDPEKLKKAEENYAFSLLLIDSLRNSLELQSSKLQVSKMQRSTFDLMIELEFMIFQMTGDSTYIDKLFSIMERSKSAGLWSSVKDIEFKNSRIPKAEMDKEIAIRKKIADIQGKVIAASSQDSEQEKLRELYGESLLYNQQMDSLKRVYRQKYPDYYKAKFDRSTLTLSEVSALLTSKQFLIEYSISFDYLYTLTLTKSRMTIDRVIISQKSKEDMAYILDFMKGHVESLTAAARGRYCEAASGLFKLLLGPLASKIGQSELLIIPDGSLSYLPFEALLDGPLNGSRQDYRRLPYLIRNHSICYGLTASLFFNKSSRKSQPSRRVLAVAPSYDLASGTISEYIRNAESGLPELKGTFQESKAIKRMLGGRLLTGSRATELRFKRIGPRYSILHLAMHTIPDKSNSFNSGLVFTPGADQIEDGILFGHEVYNLSLNAWLTVLSACETGSGQMAGGEGILSFGRAFIVAGCPNLIMTMWTVDDRSSQKIMIDFYRSLLSGKGIADALQKSKLEYLGKVDQLHAHPHYWAGFIELGQNQVLTISHPKNGMIYFFIICLMIVLILIITTIKKNPRLGRDIWKRKSWTRSGTNH